jgi:putative hydrolase of the HAD superfamily
MEKINSLFPKNIKRRRTMKTFFLFLITATSLLAAEPRAVVFDYGGVLAFSDRRIVDQFVCESLNLTTHELKCSAAQERRKAIKKGVPQSDFWQEYAKARGIVLSDDWKKTFNQILEGSLGINFEMFNLIDELKRREIVVGLLSNIGKVSAHTINQFGYYSSFDHCLLSCEMGVEKPNPRAYQILVEKIGIPPSDIVFFDDLPRNIDAAKKVGLDAVLFESAEQVREVLKQKRLL